MYKIQDLDLIKEPIIAKQAFITRQEPLLTQASNDYGREPNGLAIKVFYGNPMDSDQDIKTALWGDSPINPGDPRKNNTVFQASQIKNILWTKGLAPRVYAIFDGEYQGQRVACQLIDFVEGDPAEHVGIVNRIKSDIDNIGKEYGFASQSSKLGVNDVIGGKIVDIQLWAFDNKDYKETVKDIYFEKGRYGKIYYQNDDALDLHGGPRKSADRVKYLALDQIDFKDKVVWDVGCAGGFFLRYAMEHGAKRAIGMDMAEPLEAAFHVGNLLGYFNIDYIPLDLTKPIPDNILKPDIVFYLSMNFHIPTPQRIFEADTIIFEDNGRETRALEKPADEFLQKHNFKFVGRGFDHGDKAIYHLTK